MRARISVSVAVAVGLLLGTSGCTFMTTQSTLQSYDPSDGVGTAIGTVKVRNALLLSTNGERASFLVNFINDGNEPVSLRVQYTSTGGKVTSTVHLDSGEVKTFGSSDTKQFIFQGIDTEPGGLLPVWVQYGDTTGKQLLVPVLDGSQAQYKGLLPSPTPAPTRTILPNGTATPAPTPAS